MRTELKQSIAWFKGLLKQSNRKGRARVKTLRGKLLFMVYDPKTKDELPYYDTYPMIFVLEVKSNYILGLNVHYLDQTNRKILADALYQFGVDGNDEDITLKFRYLNIEQFKKSAHAKLCLKMYYTRLISNWMIIPPEQWNKMIYMPLQRFNKRSAPMVWKESKEKLRNQ